MGLFKSRDNIPELPLSASRLPPLQNKFSEEEAHELPSLAGNSNSQVDDFNQRLVKSAINDDSSDDYSSEPFSAEKEMDPKYQNAMPIPSKQNIFVKIDKFNALQSALSEIQGQIREISKQVETLKDTKTKQIEDINEWDTEMKKINQRLTKIDSDIFGEV